MKTIVVQKDINHTDLTPWLDSAQDRKAELVCFAELATSGCLTEPRPVPPLSEILGLFEKYPFRVMTGLPLDTPEGLRNVCLYHGQTENLLYYKKNLFPPFDEPDIYVPGEQTGLWKTELGKTGVAICYDIRFDDLFQQMKEAAVTTIFIPAAFPRIRISDWRDLLIQRAVETHATVIGVNAVGDDKRHEFGGCSAVIAPDGTVVGEADETSETLLEVDL